jgi:hypothetical protein
MTLTCPVLRQPHGMAASHAPCTVGDPSSVSKNLSFVDDSRAVAARSRLIEAVRSLPDGEAFGFLEYAAKPVSQNVARS